MQSMLPNVLQPDTTDHVPVLADEVRELLALEPGRDARGRHLRCRRPRAPARARPPRRRQGDRDRPRPDRAPVLRAVPAHRGRPGALSARRLLDRPRASWPRTASAPTRSCSTSASPACSSTGPSAASRTPRTRRSTCAWIPRRTAPPPSSSTRRPSASSRAIFRRYGEERFARQIARAIVRRREEQPFERTGELVDDDQGCHSRAGRFGDGHPAKRVFQALRIAVNEELDCARGRAAGRGRDAPAGWADRRDQLPLARGPDRQAFLPRGGPRLHLPAGLPGLRLRPRAGPARARPARPVRPTPARPPQPAFRLRAAAGRGEDRVVAAVATVQLTAQADGRARRSRPAPRPRPQAAPPRRAAAARRERGDLDRVVGVLLAGVVAMNVAVAPAEHPARPARP